MAHILVIDDDPDHLELISARLSASGHSVTACESPEDAEDRLLEKEFDLVLTDLEMPGKSGLEILKSAHEVDPALPVVLLTGHASVETAVEAMKSGAFDYLEKPFPPSELLVVIDKGLRQRELLQENRILKQELREKYHFENLVGKSAPMQEVFRLVEKVGPTSSTALILGESGTGKELVARALHQTSRRSHRRFIRVNCSAITETLLESELFGHERGAFTGAVTTRKGLFEVANGGTLFLDEVADTSPGLQAELLRVLQDGEIRRVGGTRDIQVDVRVIAATNQDLRARIRQGKFREDLFYRLNVVTISLPPLRERRSDIPLLVNHFLRCKGKDLKEIPVIAPEVTALFEDYHWPGNVRELENVLERALILHEGARIELKDLPEELREYAKGRSGLCGEEVESTLPLQPDPSPGWLPSLAEIEKRHIETVLKSVDGHREKASRILGITRRTLYQKIKKYGLERTLR